MSDERRYLTKAQRRWVEKLRAGYTIRLVIRRTRLGRVEYGPGLFNPEGAFVQTVRMDMAKRLGALGYLEKRPTGREVGDGGDA